MSEIKILDNAGSLSENDMSLLQGTELIIEMMKHRILVMTDQTKEIDWLEITDGMTGLYHIRSIDSKRLYQIWFQNAVDIETFKKNLFVSKMAGDAFVSR